MVDSVADSSRFKQANLDQIKFSRIAGFNRAFVLGGLIGILSIVLANINYLIGVADFVFAIVLLIVIAYAAHTIKRDGAKGHIPLFVFAVTALAGFVIGGILIFLMEDHKKLFYWVIPILIMLIVIFGIIAAFIVPSSTAVANNAAGLLGLIASSSTAHLVYSQLPGGQHYIRLFFSG